MASPPFNPSETTPADDSVVSAFPAAERTFRDIIESWLLIEHGRSGHHTFGYGTTAERNAITDWERGSLWYNSELFQLEVQTETVAPFIWATTISFTAPVQGTTATAGIFEKATTAEVWAATADKALCSDHIELSAASVTLTDAGTVALDWETGFSFQLVITANRILGNPTNGHPGTSRKVYVFGSDGTDRTLTFGNQYLGTLPTLTDIDNGRAYLLYIDCISTSHFVVSAKAAFP